MPGQLCAGQAVDDAKNGKIKDSRAYCEGYYSRTQVTVIDNPHEAGSSAAIAYEAGFLAKAAETPGDDPGCCAPCGPAAGGP